MSKCCVYEQLHNKLTPVRTELNRVLSRIGFWTLHIPSQARVYPALICIKKVAILHEPGCVFQALRAVEDSLGNG